MMNVPPSEAQSMDLYTYEAMLFHWNEAHTIDDDDDALDPQIVMPLLERINADPRLTGATAN